MGVILPLLLALAPVGHTGASYDAAAHKLEAHGAAAADLRAPSAEIARVKAERTARARAEHDLGAALTALGLEATAGERTQILGRAQVSDERFGSDGSVELTLTLPTADLDLKRKRRR